MKIISPPLIILICFSTSLNAQKQVLDLSACNSTIAKHTPLILSENEVQPGKVFAIIADKRLRRQREEIARGVKLALYE